MLPLDGSGLCAVKVLVVFSTSNCLRVISLSSTLWSWQVECESGIVDVFNFTLRSIYHSITVTKKNGEEVEKTYPDGGLGDVACLSFAGHTDALDSLLSNIILYNALDLCPVFACLLYIFLSTFLPDSSMDCQTGHRADSVVRDFVLYPHTALFTSSPNYDGEMKTRKEEHD